MAEGLFETSKKGSGDVLTAVSIKSTTLAGMALEWSAKPVLSCMRYLHSRMRRSISNLARRWVAVIARPGSAHLNRDRDAIQGSDISGRECDGLLDVIDLLLGFKI